jgi:hypothetical protein
MANISNIDDLLMGVGNSQQPATPEHKEKIQEKQPPLEDKDDEAPEYESEDDSADESDDSADEMDESHDDSDDDEEEKPQSKSEPEEDDLDEYGNKKEHLNKNMRKRLDKIEKEHQREIDQRDRELQTLRQQLANQGASKEVQQAVKDFKYDPNEEVSWEQQLSDFVKHTVTNMHSEEQQRTRQQQEHTAQVQFQQNFTRGMNRFNDFRDVVGKQPIDDAMTLALRGMADPSAFIYAASKRQPEELQRIAKLPDPYARMVEMGKLEERMRRNKPSTKAPRPLSRTKEDTSAKVVPKQKDMTGDDLLAKADAKRLATVNRRLKANR